MAILKMAAAIEYTGMSRLKLGKLARSGVIGKKEGRDWYFVDWKLDLYFAGMDNKQEESQPCQSISVKARAAGGVNSPSTDKIYKSALVVPIR